MWAQDTISKKDWKKQRRRHLLEDRPWNIEVPLWLPGFSGSFAHGNIGIEGEDGVDPEQPIEPPPGGDIGEILSRIFTKNWYLKFFFITRMSYEHKKFLVQMDGITGSVGNSIKFNYNNKLIVSGVYRTSNVRLYGGLKLFEKKSKSKNFRYELFGYAGVRAHFHKVYSAIDGVVNKLDINPVWVEPIIGIVNQFTFKRWFFAFQADYGGFLINSKYSFQLTSYVYYRAGRVSSIKVGWNHLQLNHLGEIRNLDYKIKATFSGPSLGVVFHF